MANSSSSDRTKLTSTILQFDGSNYKEWADAIKGFMCYNGIWFLIEGYGSTSTKAQPGMARLTSDAAEMATSDKKNNKALDIIQIYIAQNLKHHVNDKYTALEARNALKNQCAKPGAVSAFVAFQKLFNAQLSDGSALGPQIDALIKMLAAVNAAGISVNEQLVALLIVNCLLKTY